MGASASDPSPRPCPQLQNGDQWFYNAGAGGERTGVQCQRCGSITTPPTSTPIALRSPLPGAAAGDVRDVCRPQLPCQ